MSSTQYEVDDIVSLRTPFFTGGRWRITKIFPSLEHGVILHRCQLLNADDTHRELVKPISVGPSFIKQKLGRFQDGNSELGTTTEGR